jgi:hypothetical protein
MKTFAYSGFMGDETYNVTCADCEGKSRCIGCIHEKAKPAETGQEPSDHFAPFDSCSYCSEVSCGYRWDYPC